MAVVILFSLLIYGFQRNIADNGSYAVIKVDSHDYGSLDLGHIIRRKQEPFGWSLLTDQRQFYIDNCPGLAIEKITLDELITIMLKGEAL